MGQWFESLSAHSHDPGERGKGPETGQRPPTAPTHPGAAIAARKRALTEWNKVSPDRAYDPDLFRREILPRLGTVPLAEIMDAAGCCKASASDYRRWEADAAPFDLGGFREDGPDPNAAVRCGKLSVCRSSRRSIRVSTLAVDLNETGVQRDRIG